MEIFREGLRPEAIATKPKMQPQILPTVPTC